MNRETNRSKWPDVVKEAEKALRKSQEPDPKVILIKHKKWVLKITDFDRTCPAGRQEDTLLPTVVE
jgi:Fe-S-cluster formation regulator IscX/YfhJ